MNLTHAKTRDLGLAVLISSMLVGTVAARADQNVEPSPNPPAQGSTQTDENRPAVNSPSRDPAAADVEVGDAKSNVDEKSSSGSYYPNSAGTVGDDPAYPKSTAVPSDAGDNDSGPTDQWGDTADSDGDGYLSRAELTEAAPALAASFEAMDVDGDAKLTRGEFRSWHESHKARADTDDKTSKRVTPPADDGN